MSKLQKSLLGSGVLALVANLFFFRQIGVSGVAVSILFFNIYTLITGYENKKLLNKYTVLLEGSGILFLTLAIFRTTPIIQLLLLQSAAGVTLLLAYLLHAGQGFFFAIKELIFLPLVLTGSYFSSILDTFFPQKQEKIAEADHKKSNIAKHIVPTFVGLTLGVPVVIVLVGLFSSADPIFGKTVQNILNTISISDVGWRVLWTIGVFLALVPWGMISIKSNLFKTEKTRLPQSMIYPMTIVMTLIGLTLGAFLIIQWPYVFARVAAETDLSAFGLTTYSEYVKRGFIEFLFIAGILYSLLWGGLLALRAKKEKTVHPLQFIQSIVIFLFIIFLVSVGRRILLYWDFHGLSLIRIYGGVFLLWVGFLTTLLWTRHFFNFKYITVEIIGTLLFLSFLGFWNAEQFIYAHHPPTVNGAVDAVYLSRFSADGYAGWLYVYNNAKVVLEDRQYSQKPFLNADDRREIAYAGISLAELTDHYHSLLMKYGSLDEQQSYMTAIFQKESSEVQQTTHMFEDDLKTLQQKGNTATVSSTGYVAPERTGRDTGATLGEYMPEMRKIASITAQLSAVSGEKKYADNYYEFVPRSSRSIGSFSDGTCYLLFYIEYSRTVRGSTCVPSFYVLNAYPHAHTLTMVDKVLSWNGTEQTVFAQLKKDITLESLFILQEEYRSLWKKILLQPVEDRQVNLDVSFDAPFVESLD